ncbi:MAG: chitobiase/beta-hexosaminidase C-terminal domain-containing protein, partial [Verrucomicrobia bacterium]|nr:chitobiase/beta-hexosaminidase C-terminal domain-containing protein [Verrucomicrobiota bacterium]
GNFTYPFTGKTDNQLRTLNRLGLLNPAINEANISGYAHLSALTNLSASLEERARSYLDANCANCHRPGGTGPTVDARYDTPLASQNITNAVLSKGDLGYDNARVVVAKDLYRSVLWDRMNTTNTTVKMQPLARNLIDTNAVKVIGDWILSLPGTPALMPPVISPNSGTYVSLVNVSIQPPDANAAVYFTLDNTLPTTSSQLYTGQFTLASNATVTANAFETGSNNSVAVSATYVIRPPVVFTAAGYFTNQTFTLPLSGLAGKSYVLQASTNLVNWVSIGTNVAGSSQFQMTDTNAPNVPYQFYRVLEQP